MPISQLMVPLKPTPLLGFSLLALSLSGQRYSMLMKIPFSFIAIFPGLAAAVGIECSSF